MYKFITLPLASNASEDEQQELYNELKKNNQLWKFVKQCSNYNDFPEDECVVCGEFANGCNCDGYYDKRKR